jgi:hypothetical protein
MKKNKTVAEMNSALIELENEVQNTTTSLMDLIKDDRDWWVAHLPLLAGQPLNTLKQQLAALNDTTFEPWELYRPMNEPTTEMEPLETLVWLAALCRIDRMLINVLPHDFIDTLELQWRVLALHWLV